MARKIQQVIFDTNVVIDYMRGREPVASRFKNLLNTYLPVLTTISLFELYRGIEENQRYDLLNAILPHFQALVFDADTSQIAAMIDKELSKKGIRIEVADLFIASIALSKNLPILTSNAKHFKRVTGLKLLTP